MSNIVTRADFYLLSTPLQEINLFVCRLIQKIYLQQHSVFVYVQSSTDAIKLDTLLWTFNDISFIPHAVYDATKPMACSVQIGHTVPQNKIEILCNLTQDVPSFHDAFDRIVEIVPQEPESRANARKKYQAYQTLNYQLATHNI